MGVIYKIINSINNKLYIGSTKNLPQRWYSHKFYGKRGFASPLYEAMKNIGVDNFNIEIIEECPDNKLIERELFWIIHFDSFLPNGYNWQKPMEQKHWSENPHPKISFRVSEYEFNMFKKFREHGYSARELLEILVQKGTREPITLYSKKSGEILTIPRYFLIKNKPKQPHPNPMISVLPD